MSGSFETKLETGVDGKTAVALANLDTDSDQSVFKHLAFVNIYLFVFPVIENQRTTHPCWLLVGRQEKFTLGTC